MTSRRSQTAEAAHSAAPGPIQREEENDARRRRVPRCPGLVHADSDHDEVLIRAYGYWRLP